MKIDDLKKKVEDERLKDCTHQPIINKKRSKKNKSMKIEV